MKFVEPQKYGIVMFALAVSAFVAPTAAAEDWRSLRPIDLPAEVVRATWGDESYLSEGHPKVFGRVAVYMDRTDAPRKFLAKSAGAAWEGVLVDELVCYNSVAGSRLCSLLMYSSNRCYLVVRAATAGAAPNFFDVDCPVDLALGKWTSP